MCRQCKSMEQVAKDAYDAAEKAQTDLENAERELRIKRAENTRLRNQIEREHGESAEAKVVCEIIEFWAIQTGHTGAKISPIGARADAVRKAIRLGHTVDELKEAILGAAKYPFVVSRQRSATGTEKQRYDDLTTVFRDEVQIARMRKLADVRPDESGEASEEPISAQERWRRLHYPHARVMASLWDLGTPIEAGEDEWRTHCPVHFGEGLITRRSAAGLMSVVCERGCEFWRLLAALDLEPGDLFENAEQDPDRWDADVHRSVPAHLSEAAGVLAARLSGVAASGNGV